MYVDASSTEAVLSFGLSWTGAAIGFIVILACFGMAFGFGVSLFESYWLKDD
jgi:hypothetical protein